MSLLRISAKYLCVTCLGIDLLADDISKPWNESPTAIIEINAGPGVFMHLAPAKGGSINVPDMIMKYWFDGTPSGRIPIIATNRLSEGLATALVDITLSKGLKEVASYTNRVGLSFNNRFIAQRDEYSVNIKNALRNPWLDCAILECTEDNILDYGMFFKGADIVILDDPSGTEEVLIDSVIEGGILIETGPRNREIVVSKRISGRLEEVKRLKWETEEGLEETIAEIVKEYL